MRIIFFGTAEFGIPSLKVLQRNYPVVCVVTNPDKPAGRGRKLSLSPIKETALQLNIPILQPESIKAPTFIDELKKMNSDLFIVIAYRIIPPEVFTMPKFGAINLHASLLPKYRGAAPIQWAIINGEHETGVTTFFLNEKVDTGDIILQERVPISSDETAGELHDKLAEIGADLVLNTIRLIEVGKAQPRSQDNSLTCPAPKIFPEQCKINWTKPAQVIHNFVRGLSPKPGAHTFYENKVIKIYRTQVVPIKHFSEPGSIIKADKCLIIATGEGGIEILQIQREGKQILGVQEFLRGYHMKVGNKFS